MTLSWFLHNPFKAGPSLKRILRAPFVVSVGVILLVAGCLLPPHATRDPYEVGTYIVPLRSGIPPANLSVDTYYAVLVSGAEHWQRIGGDPYDPVVQCPRSSEYSYNNATQSVRYNGARYSFNEQNLKILLMWDYARVVVDEDGVKDGCQSTSKLVWGYSNLESKIRLRPDFDAEVFVQSLDGFIHFNKKYFVPIGNKVHVNLTRVEESANARYYITSDFEVVNLGAWDKDDLTRTA